MNGDGFGFGWYPSGQNGPAQPALFHSTEPAWNDENLRELTGAIKSPLFFTHVRAAAGETVTVADLELRRPGRRMVVEVSASPIHSPLGETIYALCCYRDITDRWTAEEGLARDAHACRTLFEHAPHEVRARLNI